MNKPLQKLVRHPKMNDTRLPITILTGFLGAGKSTLLNKLLAQSGPERIAVIINEYGEVALDHQLVSHTDEEIVVLDSGCVCCKIRRDLVKAIQSLVVRRASGAIDFSRIVIETTGLADPVPIQRALLTDPELGKSTFLDGIVTLADAVSLPNTLGKQFEAVSQVVLADMIVMTKTDLVDGSEVDIVRQRVQRLNPQAKLVDAATAAKNPSVLWGCGGVRRNATEDQARSWLSGKHHDGSCSHEDHTAPLVSAHEAKVETASITLDQPLSSAKLNNWLRELSNVRGEDVLRIKGLVFVEGEPAPLIFHAVQHLFDGPIPLSHWDDQDRSSKVVIIARNMSQTRLRRTLRKLAA